MASGSRRTRSSAWPSTCYSLSPGDCAARQRMNFGSLLLHDFPERPGAGPHSRRAADGDCQVPFGLAILMLLTCPLASCPETGPPLFVSTHVANSWPFELSRDVVTDVVTLGKATRVGAVWPDAICEALTRRAAVTTSRYPALRAGCREALPCLPTGLPLGRAWGSRHGLSRGEGVLHTFGCGRVEGDVGVPVLRAVHSG